MLRGYQKEACNALQTHEKKCLINMWCGTGKTRIFYNSYF